MVREQAEDYRFAAPIINVFGTVPYKNRESVP